MCTFFYLPHRLLSGDSAMSFTSVTVKQSRQFQTLNTPSPVCAATSLVTTSVLGQGSDVHYLLRAVQDGFAGVCKLTNHARITLQPRLSVWTLILKSFSGLVETSSGRFQYYRTIMWPKRTFPLGHNY